MSISPKGIVFNNTGICFKIEQREEYNDYFKTNLIDLDLSNEARNELRKIQTFLSEGAILVWHSNSDKLKYEFISQIEYLDIYTPILEWEIADIRKMFTKIGLSVDSSKTSNKQTLTVCDEKFTVNY